MTGKSTKANNPLFLNARLNFRKLENYEMERFIKKEETSGYKRLRKAGFRKCLVLIELLLLLTLPTMGFFQDRSNESSAHLYFTVSFFLLVFLLYCVVFPLRASIRLIADAPDDFLDERQIRLRDTTYRVSYQLLAGITTALTAILLGIGVNFTSYPGVTSGLFVSLLVLIIILPTMTLAWREKEI